MFTGIIEETAKIQSIQQGKRSSRITLSAFLVLKDLKVGDSIAVNGICLTVIEFDKKTFTVDVMPETIRRTSLKNLTAGSRVNLERALRLTDRLGGHMVSGHIDGLGKITGRREEDNAVWFTIETESTFLKYIVEKGSVALDGISLTVASVSNKTFDVSVIPHTRQITTILEWKTGTSINIECDIIAKYVENLGKFSKTTSKIDMNFLEKHDFLY